MFRCIYSDSYTFLGSKYYHFLIVILKYSPNSPIIRYSPSKFVPSNFPFHFVPHFTFIYSFYRSETNIMWRTQFEKRSGEKSIKMECGTRLGVYHFLLLLSAAQILAIGEFVLFFRMNCKKNNNIIYILLCSTTTTYYITSWVCERNII